MLYSIKSINLIIFITMPGKEQREAMSHERGSKIYTDIFDAKAYLSARGIHDVYAMKNVIHKCSRGFFTLERQVEQHIAKLEAGTVFGWKQTSNPGRKQEGVIGYIHDGWYTDAWYGTKKYVGHVTARELSHKPAHGKPTGLTRPD